MFTAVMMLLLPEPIPMPTPVAVPAFFQIALDARTPVSMSINGQKIEPNKIYRTEALEEDAEVLVVLRFVSGGEVVEQELKLTVSPGHVITFTVSIVAKPLVLECFRTESKNTAPGGREQFQRGTGDAGRKEV